MGVIKQFNYVQGVNQLYVEDFANISNSANNALAGLPWTTPLSICNASFSGSGSSKVLNITPDTLVVVNGIVFGSDVTVQMTSSQYLYAVCEYDTSQPRQDGEGDQYFQAVVRKIQVSDSPLSNTDLSNAAIFPGIGNYPILSPNFSDSTGSIKVNSDGSISPFKSVIPDGGVTTIKIADNAITTQKIASESVIGDDIAPNTIDASKILGLPCPRSQFYTIGKEGSTVTLEDGYTIIFRSFGDSHLTVALPSSGISKGAVIYIVNSEYSPISVSLPSVDVGDSSVEIPTNKTAKVSIIVSDLSSDMIVETIIVDSFGYTSYL